MSGLELLLEVEQPGAGAVYVSGGVSGVLSQPITPVRSLGTSCFDKQRS